MRRTAPPPTRARYDLCAMGVLRVLAGFSAAVCLTFSAWLAFGPAPCVRPTGLVAGGKGYFDYLAQNPSAWPTEPDYSLSLGSDLRVPFEAIITWAAILPVYVVTSWGVGLLAARDRRRRGLCGECGYDLRATPQRCPECGTPAAS